MPDLLWGCGRQVADDLINCPGGGGKVPALDRHQQGHPFSSATTIAYPCPPSLLVVEAESGSAFAYGTWTVFQRCSRKRNAEMAKDFPPAALRVGYRIAHLSPRLIVSNRSPCGPLSTGMDALMRALRPHSSMVRAMRLWPARRRWRASVSIARASNRCCFRSPPSCCTLEIKRHSSDRFRRIKIPARDVPV